jgi:gamma-glutamyltranspeptidase/glutathione hydrolase
MPREGLAHNRFQTMIPAASGCVTSYCPVASAIGTRVLEDGGNAVDAAVATGLALAVTYPQAGNLGGGGFMLIKVPGQEVEFLDYRESAPMKAEPRHFLASDGRPTDATVVGPMSVAVPGTVAGFAAALEKYGKWSWERVVSMTIDLAEKGIWITNRQARYLALYRQELRRFESTAKAFFQFSELRPGDLFRQPDLGKTLRILAEKGPQAFYTGPIGEQIAADMKKLGGVMELDDLAGYKPIWRKPYMREWLGREVYTSPLPSGGGLVVLESLGLMDACGIENTSPRGLDRYELLARAFRVAFKDRSTVAGDPARLSQEFNDLAADLAMRKYAEDDLERMEREAGLLQTPAVEGETPARNTTHFAAVDASGMAVSNTYSLNTLFGSKYVPAGTGVIMNNTIDDFGVAPGVPNWYLLFEGANNLLAPGARPIGSMSPTLVLENDQVEIAVGASGGPRIPTLVVQVLVGMLVDNLSLRQAMQAARVHHQYLPAEIHLENNAGMDVAEKLEARGFPVAMYPRLGIGAGIHYKPSEGAFQATLDPRF